MTDRFERAFEKFAIHEGGKVDDPDDPGGRTNKGITQSTYDAHRDRQGLPTQDVYTITDAEVYEILKTQYWDSVRGDALPDGVAYCVADAAVNSGPAQAAKWLQRIVGVEDDGIVGEKTVSATNKMEPAKLIRGYCAMRLAFMRRLAHWPKYKNGWTRRVEEVQEQAIAWADARPVQKSQEVEVAKARGEKSLKATAKDLAKNPSVWTGVVSATGPLGAFATGDGPVQWAFGIAFIVVVVAVLFYLGKKSEVI